MKWIMELGLNTLSWILGLKVSKKCSLLSDAHFCAVVATYHYGLTTITYMIIFSAQRHFGNCFKSLVEVGHTALEEKLWRDGTRKKIKMVKIINIV